MSHRPCRIGDMSLMAAKTCSKAISEQCLGHGKSPCFSDVAFVRVVSPDYPLLVLHCVNGANFLECAF